MQRVCGRRNLCPAHWEEACGREWGAVRGARRERGVTEVGRALQARVSSRGFLLGQRGQRDHVCVVTGLKPAFPRPPSPSLVAGTVPAWW